jgi:hypothetical protein
MFRLLFSNKPEPEQIKQIEQFDRRFAKALFVNLLNWLARQSINEGVSICSLAPNFRLSENFW